MKPDAGRARMQSFAEAFGRHEYRPYIVNCITPMSLRSAGASYEHGVCSLRVIPTIQATSKKAFPNGFLVCLKFLLGMLYATPVLLALRPSFLVISVPEGESALGVFISGKLLHMKIFFDYRDQWEDDPVQYGFLKRIAACFYRKAEMVSCVTSSLVTSLRRRGVDEISYVPNGADTRVFHPYPKTQMREKFKLPSVTTVVYLGSANAYYRVDLLVEALRQVRRRGLDLALVLIGSDFELGPAELEPNEPRFSQRVFHLGPFMARDVVAMAISCGDFGVIPFDSNRLWDNALPAKFFEYCACGLPVVATVSPGSELGRLIRANNVGVIAKPDDANALCDALEEIYSASSLVEGARSRARNLVVQSFDRDRTAELLVASVEAHLG